MSYASEDAVEVGKLRKALEAAGIPVWHHDTRLLPGEDRQKKIREAITGNALAFIACFSQASLDQGRSDQYRELLLAVEESQSHSAEAPWLIPVRLDDCKIPDTDLGGGRTLARLYKADLFGENREQNMAKLVEALSPTAAPSSPAVLLDEPVAASKAPIVITRARRRWIVGVSTAALVIAAAIILLPRLLGPGAPISAGRIGKPVGSQPVNVLKYYSPTGLMGDIGDITEVQNPGNNLVRMTYEARGRGPHEWDYTYKGGKINPSPSWFAGIMLLDGDWGRTPQAGYDLTGSTTISWEAKSLTGNVWVKFLAGGASWVWDDKTKTKVVPTQPDTLPGLQLGEQELTTRWQRFEYPLYKNVRASYLRAVIAAFGWTISLDSNGGHLGRPRTFIIEVRNITYG